MSAPAKPLIVFDVGNSRVKAGLFDLNEIAAADKKLPTCHRAFASDQIDEIFFGKIVEFWITAEHDSVPAIIAGSASGGVETIIARWNSQKIAKPIPLLDRSLIPLKLNVTFPEKVGLDRLLTALGANRLRKPAQPAIVVDSGTATTVNLLDSQGVFQGGAILPGLRLSAKALHEYTQVLPLIPLEEFEQLSHGPVGKETREAIRSGLFWGHLGAIRELTTQFFQASKEEPLKLLTGGGGEILSSELDEYQYLPHLSLQGLSLLAEPLLKE